MSDIFVSYAGEDKKRAKKFAKSFKSLGWSEWWDDYIPPGSTFDSVIRQALDEASCVVVLWSNYSVNSDWVKDEAVDGRERNMLVPARIDDVDLPLGFARIEAAQLVGWRGDRSDPEFQNLIASIE